MADATPRERWARASYRAWLHAYPRGFRAEYGDSMTADFLRLRRSVARAGAAGLAWLWLRTIADMMRTGMEMRLSRGEGRDGTTTTGGEMLGDLIQDLRYAVRTLGRSPAYTAIVVVTLALGIGANTAMFSLVDGVLLAPLPYAQGDRIVHVRQDEPLIGEHDMPFSVEEIADYREGSHTLTDVVEYHNMTFTLLGMGEPKLVQTGVVSARFFDVLGMTPILGRTFTEEDDRLGAEPVMMLSYEYWTTQFGSDPEIIGRGFTMNDRVHTVVGVLPPIPQYPDQNDVYMPTSQCPTRSSDRFIANRTARMMTVFGVLRPDVELSAAQQDLAGLADRIARDNPEAYQADTKGYGATISPLKDDLVSGARPTLLVLMATTVLVLLVACANVASLALARAVRQGSELAVRRAIGAGRGRLVRQLLTESTVLAVLGGLLGVVLAWLSLGLLVKFAGRFTPRAFETTMDGRVLQFALLASLVTGLFFGSIPALRRADVAGSSIGRVRATDAGRESHRAHASLVTIQVALAFVLLMGAGLLGRTFVAVSSVDLGYVPQRVLSANVILPMRYFMGSDVDAADNFFDELLARVAELPGVRGAARAQAVPLNGANGRTGLETEENADVGPDQYVPVVAMRVSAGYLGTLGIPIAEGRPLTESDARDSTAAVVVATSLARSLWGSLDPLDRRVRVCSFNSARCGEWLTVVGVAGDVKLEGLESGSSPALYLPPRAGDWNGNSVVIRADGDLAALGRALTDVVHRMEPEAPLDHVQPLQAYVADAVAPRRLTAALMAIFAGLALVVTLAGVAGVVAFTTTRRQHEIGVRVALGANPGTVAAGVVRTGLLPAVAGLALGGVIAWALSGSLSHLVWGVRPTDAVTFAGAAAALLVGALLACWLPARRATRVDPVTALRSN